MADPDLYEVLGVAPTANLAEIARAYRHRLREVHPDTANSTRDPSGTSTPAELRAIQQAYLVLRDPAQRARYDAERTAKTASPPERTGVPVRVHVRSRPTRVPNRLIHAGPVRIEPLPPRQRPGCPPSPP